MIDQMVSDPGTTQEQLAEQFGLSKGWVWQIVNSQVFKDRLRERANGLIDPMLLRSINEKVEALVGRSLEIMMLKLDDDPKNIPDQLVIRALELSTKAMGLGQVEGHSSPLVNVSLHLEQLGDNLTSLLRRRKQVIEQELISEESKEG